MASILLKAGLVRQDWRKVRTVIWLLESLKLDSARDIDRFAELDAYLGGEMTFDEVEKSYLEEQLRTKNDL